jgi:integrase
MLTIRSGNRRARVKLGIYPALSLAKAREKAKDLLAEARVNKAAEPTALTFREALNRFYQLHVPTMRTGSQCQCTRILDTRFRSLDRRRLPELKTSELAAIIDGIASHAEKRNAFVWVRTFLNWSYRRGYLDQNPISRLRGYGASRQRERVLSDAELVSVWQCAPLTDYGALVRLLILTGQRKGQWLAFEHRFLDAEKMVITWPSEIMKAGRVHAIPCTDTMRCLIGNRSSFGKWTTSYNKRALDKASGTTGWTLHDLRRTFATNLAEMGTAPHVIERILSHQTGVISGVAATYNRASYMREMRAAMEAWEARLQSLVE